MMENETPITQKDVDRAKREADKKLGGLTSEQVEQLKVEAKHNLFFLAYGLLGFNKLSKNLHGDLCRFIAETDKEQYRMFLLPRSHFKSTVGTIADSIRIVLPDTLGTAPYPRNLGSNARILICHEVGESAQAFLGGITQHFLTNPWIVGLFPELVPNLKAQKVNKSELELPRSAYWNEATFTAMGTGAKKQGLHVDYIKADDLIGEEARDSKTVMDSAIQWVDNLQSFLVTPKTDHIDFIGTRWKVSDVWSHIIATYGDQLKIYHRAVEEKDEKGVKKPIFPEQFTTDSLRILRKNVKVWTAQYLNDPKEGTSEFEQGWKRYFEWKKRRVTAVTPIEELSYDIGDLDIVFLIDPAVNGDAAFMITGMDRRKNIFVLDAMKKVWSPPELVNEIFTQVLKWRPRTVVIEDVLFSVVFQHWIMSEMSKRGIRFRIEGAKTKQKQKDFRVRGLSNYFAAGQIFFNITQQDLIEEFDTFGSNDDYHMLDALAYGPEYWRTPVRKETINSLEAAKARVANIDPVTGYSR